MQIGEQEYDILQEKYNLIKKIGVGATATVKLAKEIGKEIMYAVKLLKTDNNRVKNSNLQHFNSEVDTLKKLKHENIINLIDSGFGTITKLNGIKKQKHYIVLEYAANCELFDFVYFAKKGLGEKISRGLFHQLLSGLDSCHKSGVVHRDLKTENLMLTEDWQLKIADFGYATNIQGKNENGILSTFLGTLNYASPEIVGKKFYKGAPSDIFSCGVILYVLVTGRIPFGKAAVQDPYYRNFVRNDPDNFWKLLEPKIGMPVTQEFKSLLNKIFTYDAEKRISIEEIFNHPWMNLEMPSKDEITNEFKLRKEEVQELKELERLQMEEEESGGVYRCGQTDLEYSDKIERGIRDYVKTNNPYKVLVKGQNYEDLYYKMISFFDKDVNKSKKIQRDETYTKFNVVFDLDEDVKALVDENTIIPTLEIQVEVKKLNDKDNIVEWNKINGDRLEFFELFQQFAGQN